MEWAETIKKVIEEEGWDAAYERNIAAYKAGQIDRHVYKDAEWLIIDAYITERRKN